MEERKGREGEHRKQNEKKPFCFPPLRRTHAGIISSAEKKLFFWVRRSEERFHPKNPAQKTLRYTKVFLEFFFGNSSYSLVFFAGLFRFPHQDVARGRSVKAVSRLHNLGSHIVSLSLSNYCNKKKVEVEGAKKKNFPSSEI